MAKRKVPIAKEVLSCILVFVILVSVVPSSAFAMRDNNSVNGKTIRLADTEVKAASVLEIKFAGTAVERCGVVAGADYWIVNVEELINGPPWSGKLTVYTINIFADSPIWGYADLDITVGDKVEVYGKCVSSWGGKSVTLNGREDYYIKKTDGTKCGKITNWKTACTNVQLGGKFGAEMGFDNLMAGGYRFKGIVRVRSSTDEVYSGENQPSFVPSSPNNHGKFAGGNTLYVAIPEGASTSKYDVKLELWNADTNILCDETEWKGDIFTVEDGGAVSEIVFIGTALEYQGSSMPGAPSIWTVSVDKISSGPQPCSSQLGVSCAAVAPPWGYMDPNIKKGDKVKVYGEYWEEQENCGVTLVGSDDYYIKKSSSSGSIKITSVSPQPGTTLNAGDTVTFTVNVDYDLGPSDYGKIRLSVNQYTTGATDKEYSIGTFEPHSGSYTFNHTETIGDDWENVYVSVTLYAAKQGKPLPAEYTDFDYKQYQVGDENKIIEVDDDFVDDPPNHRWDTIQEGVNDANGGDTVLVYSGTYYENVIVNKSIILVGEDKNTTIIDGGGSGDVITIRARNCAVKDFWILNGSTNWEGSGIELWFSSNINIEDNIIGMENANLMYCGIDIWSYCNNIIIKDNYICYTNFGINGGWIDFNNCTIQDNYIHHAGGITLSGVNDTLIQGNYISYGDTGIHLDSAYNNKLQYNIISHNNYGVHIWDNSNNNTIVGNNISDNSLGIYISLSTFGNRIYHNNLIDNVATDDGTNFWDNGYPSGGNYWSDYRVKYPDAKEIDDSGIWDSPYDIPGNAGAKDNYPLMEPWGKQDKIDYWAVLVANETTAQNVQDLYNVLLSSSNWEENHIHLLIGEDATEDNIQLDIAEWMKKSADGNDVCLFVFSGHGARKQMRVYDGYVSVYKLKEWLQCLDTSTVTVILDSCLSGSFIEDLEKDGFAILTSCNEHESTGDHLHFDNNQLFSFFVIQGLWGAADMNDDRRISVEEIFNYAEPRVLEASKVTRWNPHPQISDKHKGELDILIMPPASGIQEIVEEAQPGAEVKVPSGTYHEQVIIDKPLTLIGEDVTIDGGSNFGCIFVKSDKVNIEGFTLKNGKYGIYLDYSSNNEITNNIMSSNQNGLYVFLSDENILTKNNVTNNDICGIHLVSSNSNLIRINNISNNRAMPFGCIALDLSSDNMISGNNITSTYHPPSGIILKSSKGWSSNNNKIVDNSITNNDDGIILVRSNNTIISGNTIFKNRFVGISIRTSNNSTMISNTIFSNGASGVELSKSNNNKIFNNIASDNSQSYSDPLGKASGIHLEGSNDNLIHHNNLIENKIQAYDDTGTNSWDNGYPSGGNYWSNYEEKYPDTKEIDESGIWDTPYEIPEDAGAKDNYPLMKPWGDEVNAKFVTNGWPDCCSVSDGTYKPGDIVRASCRVENTGSAQERFVVVFNVKAPDGRIYSKTSRYGTILPGRRHSFLADMDDLLLRIPRDANTGFYDVKLEVKGYDTGKIYDIWPSQGWKEDQFKIELISSNEMVITAFCPVDLSIKDPEGFTINKQLNKISNATYIETDINGDGDPDDQIIIRDRKMGDYRITVIPEPDAEPTDTYTLKVSTEATTTALAENVPISEIPVESYIFKSDQNQPPLNPTLTPDKSKPQHLGTAIPWNITNNEVDDSDPTIVQISNGDILVAYTNWLNGAQIYLTRSSDNGLTWSTPVAITNRYHNIDPYITHTSNGKVWIVWTGSWVPGDFDNYYVTSDDNGQTWSEIKHIPTPEDWGTHTTIAEDSNHNVWIMWGDHYVISDDFGEQWSQINQMPSWNGNNPSLFCDADGRLWIVTWSGGDIRYKVSHDNGQTWSPSMVVVDELSQDEAIVIPEITQFVDGTIWITYHSNINGNREVYYTSSSDIGNTWSNPKQITDNSSQDWMPAIASINDVEIWVTWDSNRDGDRDIYLTKFLIIC